MANSTYSSECSSASSSSASKRKRKMDSISSMVVPERILFSSRLTGITEHDVREYHCALNDRLMETRRPSPHKKVQIDQFEIDCYDTFEDCLLASKFEFRDYISNRLKQPIAKSKKKFVRTSPERTESRVQRVQTSPERTGSIGQIIEAGPEKTETNQQSLLEKHLVKLCSVAKIKNQYFLYHAGQFSVAKVYSEQVGGKFPMQTFLKTDEGEFEINSDVETSSFLRYRRCKSNQLAVEFKPINPSIATVSESNYPNPMLDSEQLNPLKQPMDTNSNSKNRSHSDHESLQGEPNPSIQSRSHLRLRIVGVREGQLRVCWS